MRLLPLVACHASTLIGCTHDFFAAFASHVCIFVSLQVTKSSQFVGLGLVFTAGACYSIFSPAFNLSTNDQWHKLEQGVPHLVVYTAFFYFSAAFFFCAVLINVVFLYKPAFGVPRSSLMAYARDWKGRGIALLAGAICGWGNGFQFMGGQAAGYAAADAVQVCQQFVELLLTTFVARLSWCNVLLVRCKLCSCDAMSRPVACRSKCEPCTERISMWCHPCYLDLHTFLYTQCIACVFPWCRSSQLSS